MGVDKNASSGSSSEEQFEATSDAGSETKGELDGPSRVVVDVCVLLRPGSTLWVLLSLVVTSEQMLRGELMLLYEVILLPLSLLFGASTRRA